MDKLFYDRIFVGSKLDTYISRGELESLPESFNTENVSDETMQRLIDETEADVIAFFGYEENFKFSFDNDKHSEMWWEYLERNARSLEIPYYDDQFDEEVWGSSITTISLI